MSKFGLKEIADEAIEFLDTEIFDKHLSNIGETASVMNIDESVFVNEDNAVGTEALLELSKEMHAVFDMSNTYKMHMNDGIITLLNEVKDNIISTVAATGDAIRNGNT